MAFEGLPRIHRIRNARDFDAMREHGRALHTRHLKIVVGPGPETARLGLVVSKRVSKRAVDRNRVKRMLREAFRKNRALFPPYTDLLLIAKPGSEHSRSWQLAEELIKSKHSITKLRAAIDTKHTDLKETTT